jgi:hypothetical protein
MTPTAVTRVLIWFAANPDEYLSATDIAIKFDIREERVYQTLREHYIRGWFKTTTTKNKPSLWYAGPELLKFIGHVQS